MTQVVTARAKHLAQRLERAYGIVGKVAGRYLAAGCSVELFHRTRLGPIHILVRSRGEVYSIEVVHSGPFTLEQVKQFHEKSKLVRAKPILILYGAQASLSKEAAEYCLTNGIKVKRVKPQD